MFNSFPVLSGQEPCVFPLPVSPYALHRMEMNCPSVGWIYSFIHNSGSVVQCRARERTSGLEGLSLELWPPMWSRKTGAASGPQNTRCERSFSQLSVEIEEIDTEARDAISAKDVDWRIPVLQLHQRQTSERGREASYHVLINSVVRGSWSYTWFLCTHWSFFQRFSYLKEKAFSNAESYYHWPDGFLSLERTPLLSTPKTISLDLSSHSLWSLRSGLRVANTTSFHVTSVTLRILP